MIGKQERWQEDLFVAGPLSSLIPDNPILKRVDAILDLSWLSEMVKDAYCSDNGRRSIDPESGFRRPPQSRTSKNKGMEKSVWNQAA